MEDKITTIKYDFFLGKIPIETVPGVYEEKDLRLPVPPAKLNLKIGNSNQTCTLMNEGEINILKTPGLTEIEFEAMLPTHSYPFARYPYGLNARRYLEELERMKREKRTFQFIVARNFKAPDQLFATNLTCSLEEYSILEDAETNGTDIMVSIKLKQYRSYGVKKCKVKTKKKLNLSKLRDKKHYNLPQGSDEYLKVLKRKGEAAAVEVVIKKQITLYNLAKKIYGDGSLYTIIAKANCVTGKSRTRSEQTPVMWKRSKKLKKGKKVSIPITYYS